MIAPEASKENIYVKSVKLNGTPLNRTYITHDEITSGATLEFEMSPTPCRE
jgi:putative alpha-1,2-mannosidase